MRIQIKVTEGSLECEVIQEVTLKNELEVTDQEFEALVAELSTNFAELLVAIFNKKTRKIVTLGEV